MNAEWNAGEHRDEMLPVIAQDAGMEPAAASDTIDDFVLLPVETALSDQWLGGRVGDLSRWRRGLLPRRRHRAFDLPSYGALIDTAPLPT